MNKKEIINQLIKAGWEPAPYTPQYDNGFYLWKVFEISQARELSNFTDYIPKDDELIYIEYEIYPHLKKVRYCIWSSEDFPSDIIYEEDDYDTVLSLALEDRLFTYHRHQGCKMCKHNKIRTLDSKCCRKGHRVLFGFMCRDYEPYSIGHQFSIYDFIEE